MRFIPTKIHGILDYIMGVILVTPWISYYEGVPKLLPSLAGLFILVYSLITDYELGFVKLISMKTHLVFDFIIGALLIVSPWLFNFSDALIAPFVIAGSVTLVVTLLTKPKPSDKPTEAQANHSREMKGANIR
ncbi:SPW repeat domain-containing protein [Filimonas effusa]|uniref:SPW repeat-containing integral membrane domain-containing protein n=1 Tax=Filimonas effusa TaxID=2508721 RepID=A0A4Q1DC49_9BACT|nr:hypothetical protein [Filimonas effusa]RXK86395.1 hypothetical protein ESB13_06210 [Filimonas effusa]